MSPTFALTFLAAMTLGQQDASKTPDSEPTPAPTASAKVLQEFKLDAAAHDIRLRSRPNDKLILREEPLLHWGNPARYGQDGAVYVWMLDGRPEVIGGVFTFRRDDIINRKHQLHSLAAEPVASEYHGKIVWAPPAAGIKFQPVPEAPAPAETPRLRLTQMKNLARDFTSQMMDNSGNEEELRLFPQPLIRYEPKDKRILDGALFSFAVGTDPESVLVLEARTEAGRTTWQFAFARFHYYDLKASYKGREVWHVKSMSGIAGLRLGDIQFQDSPYVSYHAQATKAPD